MGSALEISWKAFPLRPEPDSTVRFKGTYREEGWRRCQAMAEPDGVRFTMWSRDDYPHWSLPALEAAKCVALQGADAFERLHLALYEAFFTRGVNIAEPREVVPVIAATGADMDRFLSDFESGAGREAVLRDWEDAVVRDRVRAIPTVLVEGGRRLTGLVDLLTYRQAFEEP